MKPKLSVSWGGPFYDTSKIACATIKILSLVAPSLLTQVKDGATRSTTARASTAAAVAVYRIFSSKMPAAAILNASMQKATVDQICKGNTLRYG